MNAAKAQGVLCSDMSAPDRIAGTGCDAWQTLQYDTGLQVSTLRVRNCERDEEPHEAFCHRAPFKGPGCQQLATAGRGKQPSVSALHSVKRQLGHMGRLRLSARCTPRCTPIAQSCTVTVEATDSFRIPTNGTTIRRQAQAQGRTEAPSLIQNVCVS